MNQKKLSRIAMTIGGVLFSLFFWAVSPNHKQTSDGSILRTAENPLLFSIPQARADVPAAGCAGDESVECCSDCGDCGSGDCCD